MSRLDSFIRRLEAQRACLDAAITAIRDVPGAVLELGLGNGRTYDHLRSRLNGSREIFAFDRQLAAHPDCIPDKDHLVLGDFRETLPTLARRLAGKVALVHADTGSGDSAASQAQARRLVEMLVPFLASNALIVSDQDMAPEAALGWRSEPLPAGVPAGRYHLYRCRNPAVAQ
jgi:hypothetical protein